MPTRCPACGRAPVRDLGPAAEVPGAIALADPGHIHECHACGLLFRRPYPDARQLAAAYAAMPPDHWAGGPGRRDFALARRAIRRLCLAGDVLDVGCFRGDFLAGLPPRYRRFGIEPSAPAARIASDRGVLILGRTLEEASIAGPTFDVITLFDVIEHLPNPAEALARVASWLRPGGAVIVATGNTESLLWRWARRDYWYCFPEHVSFCSQRWFQWAAGRVGLTVCSAVRFSYHPPSLYRLARQLAGFLTFRAMRQAAACPWLYRPLARLYPFSRAARWPATPPTTAWPDHILVVLRSPQPPGTA